MEDGYLSRSIGISSIFVDTKDGSAPRRKLIFKPIIFNTALNLEPEKDISYEGDRTKFSGKFLFPPQSAYKLIWDCTMIVFILLQGVYIPLLIAFEIIVNINLVRFDFLVSVLFLLDILFNFNSGYLKKGAIVMNRNLICKHYLRTWFLVDMIATFPYDWAVSADPVNSRDYSTSGNFSKFPKLLRVIKITKFLLIFKLLKLAKVKQLLYRVEDYLNSELFGNMIVILRILMVVFYIAHWNACIWYFVTDHFITEETWLNKVLLVEDTNREFYIDSMYWSVYTMITVGYGDIRPICTTERLLAIFSMVLASGLFGYLIGEASTVINKHTEKETTFQDIQKNLNFLFSTYKVHEDLKQRIRHYIAYTFENQWNYQKEHDILQCMSVPLREEITHIIYWPCFQHCGIFLKNFPSSVVNHFSNLLFLERFSPLDHIIRQYDLSRKMHFIMEGTVEIYLLQSKRNIDILKEKGYFGEIGFFANDPRTASAVSVGFTELLSLEYEDIWNALSRFPASQQILEDIEIKCRESYAVIDLRCSFCGKIGHPAVSCFDIEINKQTRRAKEKWLKLRSKKKKLVSIKKYYNPSFKRKIKESKDVSPMFFNKNTGFETMFGKNEMLRAKAKTYRVKSLHKSYRYPEVKFQPIALEDIYVDSDSSSLIEDSEASAVQYCEPEDKYNQISSDFSETNTVQYCKPADKDNKISLDFSSLAAKYHKKSIIVEDI